jgi:anti-sigma regulatory factor (Ser/Thr protein kinase)
VKDVNAVGMEALRIPATLESLGMVGRYVMEAAAAASIDKRQAYRLRLAVDEVVTNIIAHGYQEAGRDGDVALRAIVAPRTLTIVVEDSAVAFDPRQVPEPVGLDDPLEERAIGGLGIYLAIRGVDEFQYESPDGRNRNIFVVYRTPVPIDDVSRARSPKG